MFLFWSKESIHTDLSFDINSSSMNGLNLTATFTFSTSYIFLKNFKK